ncbi:hypothetical protein RvY_19057 [Ramazzottius varieornatus]|uniref:Uncharacterized protein n=1 Tax=Ramazzottius varieornatus TaxID=947166 RepID=A0A1D1W829_RAMVA|nr:hypothetical protein RvY_19057 [Ramazzottius varieornatus]
MNITAARLPTGTCFKQQNFDGAPACVCTDRQNCNDKPFVGKNTKGEYVTIKDKPDSQGNVITTSGGPGSALSVDRPGSSSPPGSGGADNYVETAVDVTNNPAGGVEDGAGGQGGSSGGSQLTVRSTIFLVAFFFLIDMQPADARGPNF